MGDHADDDGFTVIELVVAMSVLSFFLTVFTTGIIAMYRAANEAETTQALQSRLNVVFERLDAEIRYAEAISTPSCTSGCTEQYIEYLSADGCGQLRFTGGQLQRRQWEPGDTPSGAWTTLVTGLTGDTPFLPEQNSNQRQQLRLRLTAQYAEDSRTTEFMFTALNSDTTADNSTVCKEGR